MKKLEVLNLALMSDLLPHMSEEERRSVMGGSDTCNGMRARGVSNRSQEGYFNAGNNSPMSRGAVTYNLGYLGEETVYGKLGGYGKKYGYQYVYERSFCNWHFQYFTEVECPNCYYEMVHRWDSPYGGNYGNYGSYGSYSSYGNSHYHGANAGYNIYGNPNYGNNNSTGQGNGGGNDYYPENLDEMIDNSIGSTLSVKEAQTLKDIFGDFKGTEWGLALYQKFETSDKILKFEIGNTRWNAGSQTWGDACFNAQEFKIIFLDSDKISYNIVGEEFIHSIQKLTYGNDMTSTDPRFEFEAKILNIIMQNGKISTAMEGVDNIKLINFIEGYQNGTYSYDRIQSEFKEMYQQWAPDYYKDGKEYDLGDFDPALLNEMFNIN